MAEIIQEVPGTLTNKQIIQYHKEALTQLTKAATDPTWDFERTVSLGQARYNWMMVKGFQNPTLGWIQNEYGANQANLIPFDYGNSGEEETGASVRLNPPLNVLAGDCWKFTAVMGSSSPRVKAAPDDLRSSSDLHAAQTADCNIRDLWAKNKIDRKWKIPAFHLYTTGPCFARTFWNTDPIKYGQSIEPKIEVETLANGAAIPRVVGEVPYPNGDAEVSFHSILEVSVPWEAKELRGNFLRLERMVDKWWLIDKYPELAKYRDSNVPDDDMSGSSVTAAEAREATSNPSGTAKGKKANQWRFIEWWIPAHLYESIIDETPRDLFKTQFGKGLYLAKVGSLPVEIDEREVTEEWSVVTVNRGEKIMERPVCADNIPIQRAINDLIGMAIETILRAITQTIMDNQLIDRQAMSTKEAVPAEIILTALPVDGDLNKRIFQIPPAHLSDQCLPLLDKFRAYGQDISGVRPEIAGGGEPTSTYREAKQRRDQALAQLAPQAEAMRDASEDIARNLVLLRSKYGSGTVKAQRKGAYGVETDVCDMADLDTAGWHTESDDQFPMTLSDRRDALFSILHDGFSPEMINIMGVDDPMNAQEVTELMGVPGFQSAIVEQIQKTIQDIEKLLKAAPVPAPPGPPGAPPPPPVPSLPVDMFDDHTIVAPFLAKWLRGPVGQKFVNTPGFENVKVFWQAHDALAKPPVPPPPPALKGSLALSARMEDMPSLVPEVLLAAGLKAPPPPMPPTPAPGKQPLPGGGQLGIQSPLPALTPIPQGPQGVPAR